MITPHESTEATQRAPRFEPQAKAEPRRPDVEAATTRPARARREAEATTAAAAPSPRRYGAGF